MRCTILSSLFLAATALAAPGPIGARQNSVTCGNNYYSANQVANAVDQGCYGNGGGDYPHTYNNYEGFDFPISGPYQEYPIKESGVYTGGSPGADRVIFNDNCEYAGSITHTGASGNNFVGCSDTD